MAENTERLWQKISPVQLANAERFGDFCPVYRIDSKTIVKTGKSVRLAEAKAMSLVRQHTNIPIPEIYNSYKDDTTGNIVIVMEYIEGDKLEDVYDTFSSDQRKEILRQLRSYFDELRGIQGEFIGAVDRTACEDPIFDDELGGYGPFTNEDEFNEGIIRALNRSETGPFVEIVSAMIRKMMKGHQTVLTHGDFAPRNILVQGTKVVAILDWELSGFYPEYWEYLKALHYPLWTSQWIEDGAIDQVLEQYLPELAVMWHTREIIW